MELTKAQENKVIRDVLSIVKMNENYGSQELELAKVILKEFYAIGVFFLNDENDITSGLCLESCTSFLSNFRRVLSAVEGN